MRSELDSEPNFGYMGTDMCVNATMQAYVDVTTQRVRLRILNGSNARLYNLEFTDHELETIDGHAVEAGINLWKTSSDS